MKLSDLSKAALAFLSFLSIANPASAQEEVQEVYLGVTATPYTESRAFVSGHRDAPEGMSIKINIPEYIDSPDGVRYTIDSIGPNSLNMIDGLTYVNIPSSIRGIGEHAFSYSPNLTKVVINDGVETIGNAAFYDCGNLKEINIPASVRYISPEAFWSKNLENISINRANMYYKSIDGAIYSRDGKTLVRIPHGIKGIFKVHPGTKTLGEYSCRADEMTGIILPDGLEEIQDDAFLWDTKLENVTIPASVKKIGRTAFGQCHSLKEIVIPSSALNLGDNIFFECKNLASVTLPENLDYIPAEMFYSCKSLSSIKLPAKLSRIGDKAFYGCGFTEFTIPAGVTKIGMNPWSGCSSLKSISTPTSNSEYTAIDGVLFSKDRKELIAFPAGRDGIYTVPSGTTTLAKESFAMTDLNEITLPNTLTRIDDEAFQFSHYLHDIVLPESVTYIGDDAFAYSDVRSITILNPDIKHIGTRIADEKATVYIPDSMMEKIETLIKDGPDLTKDTETGAFFSIAESFGVHNKSQYEVKPLSAKPNTRMCTVSDLVSFPFAVAKSKDVWKLTSADLIGILEEDGIEYTNKNENEIFVLRQFYTEIPGRGRVQVLNHRAYIEPATRQLRGFDFILQIPREESLPAYLEYLDKGVRKAGYKIDRNYIDKKPTKLGGFYRYASKGRNEIFLAYSKWFGSLMVIMTYSDSTLKDMLRNVPDDKYICPNMLK